MNVVSTVKVTALVAVTLLLGCIVPSPSNTGTVESAVDALLLEKAKRAGFFRAAAQQAERKGQTEIATYLDEIAEEERMQLMKLSVLSADVRKDSKKNLSLLLSKERVTVKEAIPWLIEQANLQKNDSLAQLLAQIKTDDERHILGLKGALEKMK